MTAVHTTAGCTDHDPDLTPDDLSVLAAVYIGTDADGREHRFNRGTWTVYVLDGDDVVLAQALGERHLGHWRQYVKARVEGGWTECRIAEQSFSERVAETVTEQVAADLRRE